MDFSFTFFGKLFVPFAFATKFFNEDDIWGLVKCNYVLGAHPMELQREK